jgi:DNA-binding transcriptional MerR regulator
VRSTRLRIQVDGRTSSGYSLKDVCARVGLPARRVIDWAEKQVVRPELADTTGSGNPRQYSVTNLLEFAVANELVQLGITVRRVATYLETMRTTLPGFWKRAGAMRLALGPDGTLTTVGYSDTGMDHWRRFASRRYPRVGISVVLDLDALRERLDLPPAARPRRAARSR